MECPQIRKDFLNLYKSSEHDLLKELDELFEEWNNVYKEYRKGKSELQNYEMIVPDGFYPIIFHKNLKFYLSDASHIQSKDATILISL